MNSSKDLEFAGLIQAVKVCRRCPRMDNSERVLSHACGSLAASIFFVGEAPGRLGADESEIPFHGDKSGHNFEAFLDQVGLSRYEIFVTNAVLCNPKDESGNNATPTREEIQNCAEFLQKQIELVQPKVVVTLGATALRSTSLIESHRLTLKADVRTSVQWRKRLLIPLYHPGQRALIHRSFANQLSDYQFVAETLTRSTKKRPPRSTTGSTGKKTAAAVKRIAECKGNLSYFALHKLLFLAEVRHYERLGKRITNSYVVRQKDGPYFVDLHPHKLQRAIPNLIVSGARGRVAVSVSPQSSWIDEDSWKNVLSLEELSTLDQVLNRYGALSEPELKRVVYLTSPMRQMLRLEKRLRMNLFNAPLLVE